MEKRNEELDHDLFINAFHYAPIGKALVGLDGKWLKVNPALCKLLGYTEQELLTGSFQDITHPEDLHQDLHYVQEMISGSLENYTMEKRYFHKSGEIVWVLLSASLVYTKDKNPLYFISQIVNITDHKRDEKLLRENEEWFRLLADHSTDFITKHSITGIYTFVSPLCKRLLGYEINEMMHHSWYAFAHEDDVKKMKLSQEQALKQDGIFTTRYRMKKKDGTYLWIQSAKRASRNPNGEIIEILMASHDITEKIETEQLLQKANQLSSIDSLTQIPNRRIGDEKLQETWKHAQSSSSNTALILVDIDYFKFYNDFYGHIQGDNCLKKVAQTLQQTLKRKTDFVCRYGGEEFVIILPYTDEDGAIIVAEQLRRAVESLHIPHQTSITGPHLTISIGVAVIAPTVDNSLEAFIDTADKALYIAKRLGRNRMHLYK